MPNENTSLKIVTPDEDHNTTHDIVIGKRYTFQHLLLIVTSSLLALLILVAVAGKTAGYSIVYTGGFAESAGAHADYQVDTANSVLAMDFLGMGAASENGEAGPDGCPNGYKNVCCKGTYCD
mmetsp:Transcript_5190/g.5081  ORF Transcript_5190/g.5081 Transcript_5190/m.5081 type:complete len:122 (-) Transcript_5190:36-401(-)